MSISKKDEILNLSQLIMLFYLYSALRNFETDFDDFLKYVFY